MACFNIQYVMILGWLKSVISTLLLMGILILPTTISPLPAAAISVLPTEIFTFPKCYSQILLASSFSAQKFCKFTDMAAFAKSKVEITMKKIEN